MLQAQDDALDDGMFVWGTTINTRRLRNQIESFVRTFRWGGGGAGHGRAPPWDVAVGGRGWYVSPACGGAATLSHLGIVERWACPCTVVASLHRACALTRHVCVAAPLRAPGSDPAGQPKYVQIIQEVRQMPSCLTLLHALAEEGLAINSR